MNYYYTVIRHLQQIMVVRCTWVLNVYIIDKFVFEIFPSSTTLEVIDLL